MSWVFEILVLKVGYQNVGKVLKLWSMMRSQFLLINPQTHFLHFSQLYMLSPVKGKIKMTRIKH